MDCRTFRKHHFAYLDDTLPGDAMTAAQSHIMSCDGCAAHDTLVRRSIMMVRNLPTIEPSDAFSERLQQRLARCKSETPGTRAALLDDDSFLEPHTANPFKRVLRGAPTWFAIAACVAVVGAMTFEEGLSVPSELELAPVLASAPAPEPVMRTLVTPALMQAMASGNPMWSMALLVDEAPAHFLLTGDAYDEGGAQR